MSDLYQVSSSPHVRAKDSTTKIMLLVVAALMPATLFGFYNFGIKAWVLVAICIFSCVVSELLYEFILNIKDLSKMKFTIKDGSAIVTGLLLALNLPCTLPWWEAVLGSMFAIFIVKSSLLT